MSSAESVAMLCSLIKFETISAISPETGAYKACADFILSEITSFLPSIKRKSPNSKAFLLESAPEHSPVVVLEWQGKDNTLGPILLNCHYDVVPAGDLSMWTKAEPFSGEVKDGKIFGRGSQDMKVSCENSNRIMLRAGTVS